MLTLYSSFLFCWLVFLRFVPVGSPGAVTGMGKKSAIRDSLQS